MIPRLPSPDEYNYDLPDSRIAFQPLPERDASRLLMFKDGAVSHQMFRTLADHIPAGFTLFFNETKVVMARIVATLPDKDRAVEIFCLEAPYGQSVEQVMQSCGEVRFHCLIGGARHWKQGDITMELALEDDILPLTMTLESRLEGYYLVRFRWPSNHSFADVLDAAGRVPLPPYIRRQLEAEDRDRYQTIFARTRGSVAAPTAGLHFTEEVLRNLTARGIHQKSLTLHVGGGTFLPVKSERLEDHRMHTEEMVITGDVLHSMEKANTGRIAVGTTSLRYMESLYWMGVKAKYEEFSWNLEQWDCYRLPQNVAPDEAMAALRSALEREGGRAYARTALMIVPGYRFRMTNALITNFHQPKSTLLMLVAAAVGPAWKEIYREALEQPYRFLSYGDSSLLWME